MYNIWRCNLLSAFGGCIHPPNQEHHSMCIYLGIIKLIRIKRQFKSKLNSQKLKFRQISYTLNIIRLQYTFSGFIPKMIHPNLHSHFDFPSFLWLYPNLLPIQLTINVWKGCGNTCLQFFFCFTTFKCRVREILIFLINKLNITHQRTLGRENTGK